MVVKGAVALELGAPLVRAGGGPAEEVALVHVPEAAVDLDDGTVAGEDQVGGAGEGAVVQAEAEAEPVEATADGPLGAGVGGADAGHHPGADVRSDDVSQPGGAPAGGGA